MWELFLLLQVHLPESMVMRLIGKEGKDFCAYCGDQRPLLTGTWLSSLGMHSEKGLHSINEMLLRSSPHMLSISGRTLGSVLKVLFHLGFSCRAIWHVSRKAVCWPILGTDLVGKGTHPGCAISVQQGTSPSQGREGHWLYGVLGMEQEGPCLLCQASPAPSLCSHITEGRRPLGLFLPTLPSPAFCLHRCSLSLL